MLGKRLFIIILIIVLVIAFIITGAYYLLLLIVLFLLMMLISLFSMLFMSDKVTFRVIRSNENYYLKYQSSGIFPFGLIRIVLDIQNVFFESSKIVQKEFLVGSHTETLALDSSAFRMGKSVIVIQSCRLIDMLGLFSKKIVFEDPIEVFRYPRFDENFRCMNPEMEKAIRDQSYHHNEDYDIREYREGDSVKDIHYKISYRQSKVMIKDKYRNVHSRMHIFLDLSGNEKACLYVLGYLYQFVVHLSLQKAVCNIQWYSKDMLMEERISNMKEYEDVLKIILSRPKAVQKRDEDSGWYLNADGLQGGELDE